MRATIKTEAGDKDLKVPIRADVLDLMRTSTKIVDGAVKFTCGQLPRDQYEAVNEVLERIGGKWKGNKKAHVFPFDPTALFNAVIENGMMPAKNPLAFFPTPAAVSDDLCAMIEEGLLQSNPRILEPSAGQGGLVEAIRRWYDQKHIDGAESWQIDCCEMDPLNRRVLETKGINLVGENFLEYQPEHPYDLIVMNPPFSVEGDKKAWITHIEHAWSMLGNDGQIAAIVPPFGHQSDKRTINFRDLLNTYGSFEDVPANAFKESGTSIATCLVWLHKTSARKLELEGRLHHFFLNVDNDVDTDRAMAKMRIADPSEEALKDFSIDKIRQFKGLESDLLPIMKGFAERLEWELPELELQANPVDPDELKSPEQLAKEICGELRAAAKCFEQIEKSLSKQPTPATIGAQMELF